MTTISKDATSWSVERRALAEKLAESCPPEPGQAIIVTGAVARGVADPDDLRVGVVAPPG